MGTALVVDDDGFAVNDGFAADEVEEGAIEEGFAIDLTGVVGFAIDLTGVVGFATGFDEALADVDTDADAEDEGGGTDEDDTFATLVVGFAAIIGEATFEDGTA